jgi:hypothetical protein
MTLRRVHAFGHVFDLAVTRTSDTLTRVTVTSGDGATLFDERAAPGATFTVQLP